VVREVSDATGSRDFERGEVAASLKIDVFYERGGEQPPALQHFN
jgi:hypothetical protein